MKKRILVIDDELVVCESCKRVLESSMHEVTFFIDPEAGRNEALKGHYDIILLDLMMPYISGIDILKSIKSSPVKSEIIILTGFATVENAVQAMKLGAADYLSKPLTPDELSICVEKVIERSKLIQENLRLREELNVQHGFEGIIGESPAIEQVFSVIKRAAPTDGTMLITGESGTGKEMVARAIHKQSLRSREPFLSCDCGSFSSSALASELFGYVKGVFAEAVVPKQGLFEVAARGTLFLDEISKMDLEIQGLLLRCLETNSMRRIGDSIEHSIDVRVIAATSKDLAKLVKEGHFREDLYYRLRVVPIDLPPLRERSGDVERLAMFFLENFKKTQDSKVNINVSGFSPEALKTLINYPWPGNVRELKNIIERIVILCNEETIETKHIPAEISQISIREDFYEDIPKTWEEVKKIKSAIRDAAIREVERRFVFDALQRAEGNVTRAAEMVGMQRTNFHFLIRKYRLASSSIKE